MRGLLGGGGGSMLCRWVKRYCRLHLGVLETPSQYPNPTSTKKNVKAYIWSKIHWVHTILPQHRRKKNRDLKSMLTSMFQPLGRVALSPRVLGRKKAMALSIHFLRLTGSAATSENVCDPYQPPIDMMILTPFACPRRTSSLILGPSVA